MPRLPAANWSKVDLRRPARELAEELGVTTNTIYSRRRRHGTRKQPWSEMAKVDWSKVDARRGTVTALAERLGVSASTVRLHRLRQLTERRRK